MILRVILSIQSVLPSKGHGERWRRFENVRESSRRFKQEGSRKLEKVRESMRKLEKV